MRTLLIGGTGLLGSDVAATAPPVVALEAPASSALDVTNRGQLEDVLDRVRPSWVINAAAYTKVDRAEEEIPRAELLNAVAPGLLGPACAERGIAVLHYSTDYVFDGRRERPYREEDPTGPINTYGRTKLAGERALLASGCRALVVRTAWLFGANGPSFPRTMWERARAGSATRVVGDQWGRPTSTVDLARASWRLMAADASGIVHASSGGEPTTWFRIAERVFARAGASALLTECTTADYPTPAARPANSTLDIARLESLVGPMPDWRVALDRFLAELTM